MTAQYYGLGELPGASISYAADVVAGETGQLRQLPILPARLDGLALTAALLPGLHVDVGPRGWVLTNRPQLRTRRMRDEVAVSLDECEQQWGTSLDAVKVQVMGPWTLAASLELSTGHRAITDRGALRDLTEALIAGTVDHVAAVRARFDAQVLTQLDEPLLWELNQGLVPGTSEFDVIGAINEAELGERLATVVAGVGASYLNQTGYPPLWRAAELSGVPTCQVTLSAVSGSKQLDAMGHRLVAGHRIGLGVTHPGEERHPRDLAVSLAKLWDELGLAREMLAHAVDVHPSSGLAWGTLIDAAAALRVARQVSEMLIRDAGDL